MPVCRSLLEYDPLAVTYLPIENYFSDFYDGSGNLIDWDYNDDGNFGSYPSDFPAMDFVPDVFVSRIPASTPEELQIALEHIIAYETHMIPQSPWSSKNPVHGGGYFYAEGMATPPASRKGRDLRNF